MIYIIDGGLIYSTSFHTEKTFNDKCNAEMLAEYVEFIIPVVILC